MCFSEPPYKLTRVCAKPSGSATPYLKTTMYWPGMTFGLPDVRARSCDGLGPGCNGLEASRHAARTTRAVARAMRVDNLMDELQRRVSRSLNRPPRLASSVPTRKGKGPAPEGATDWEKPTTVWRGSNERGSRGQVRFLPGLSWRCEWRSEERRVGKEGR